MRAGSRATDQLLHGIQGAASRSIDACRDAACHATQAPPSWHILLAEATAQVAR